MSKPVVVVSVNTVVSIIVRRRESITMKEAEPDVISVEPLSWSASKPASKSVRLCGAKPTSIRVVSATSSVISTLVKTAGL